MDLTEALMGMQGQGMGMQNVTLGSAGTASRKPLKQGMRVLYTGDRPYRTGTIMEIASRFREGAPEYALVMFHKGSGWFSSTVMSWEHEINLVPLEGNDGETTIERE